MNCAKHGPMSWGYYPIGWRCYQCLSAINITTSTNTNKTLWNRA